MTERGDRDSLWRDIVENLGHAVIVVSPTYNLLAVNSAAETLLGVSRIDSWLVGDLVRRNQWLGRLVRSCLGDGVSLSDPEARLELGRLSRDVATDISPLIDSAGKSQGAVIVLRDLAYQRSAGLAMGEGEIRLSPAGLAHEVKTPLTSIKGAAELLAGLFPADSRAQQYTRLILDGTNRIAALIERVLAAAGPQRLAREAVNIHQVLRRALEMGGLRPQPPPGITVLEVFDPSLPEVSGDCAALEGVFLNLLSNAVEAIEPPGAIRLCTRMETDFRVTAQGRRLRFLRVEISDSGKGVTADELKQLFTPFFTTKPDGTGLGLVLSQRIIALHGGKLWAERRGVGADGVAEAGRTEKNAVSGMTLIVTLPIVRGEGSP